MKILFLASGNGGTMEFFHQAIKELSLDEQPIIENWKDYPEIIEAAITDN